MYVIRLARLHIEIGKEPETNETFPNYFDRINRECRVCPQSSPI